MGVLLFNDPEGVSALKKYREEFRNKDIRWVDFDFNPGSIKLEDRAKAAKDELERFHEVYQAALANFRTVGLDKEDEVYELIRYARLEYYTDKPASYYEINNEYKALLVDAKKARVNLGVLRGMKEKWGPNAKGTPTGLGIAEARGQKWVNEKVDVVLRHRWDHAEGAFMTKIAPPANGPDEMDEGAKCRIGDVTRLIGKEYKNLDFLTLIADLLPDADLGKWGL